MTPPIEGGCLCGAVRYRITEPVTAPVYCHCRMCQRSTGAPVTAWITVAKDRFTWTGEPPSTHRSSEIAIREFCPRCGTQLTFERTDPGSTDEVDVTVASLDNPASLAPDHHIWTESRIPWFDVADDLPRHAKAGPGGEAAS